MLNSQEFRNHLTEELIPFWNGLYDSEHGGFYGSVDSDNNINKQAFKSAVLQTRILWFYSSCYRALGDENLLEYAHRQFEFIAKHMIDPDDGGIFWEVEYNGKVRNNQKHTYALAFQLYSLSAYYSASGNEAALNAANKLFNLIERDFRDEYGYTEIFSLDKLDKSVEKSTRTMNTLLHIIEAYTEYYRAVKTDEARKGLEYSVSLVINKTYNDELCRIECNFDKYMNSVADLLSYGHDIEASWLVYRACEVLGNAALTSDLAPKLEKVAQNVIAKGFVDGGKNGVYYDCKAGIDNTHRSWWVMSEAVVALVHRYKLYKDEQSMIIAENLWNYIKTCFISPYGEWHAQVNESGEPVKMHNGLCGSWKCPYHNGRMCLELMEMLC